MAYAYIYIPRLNLHEYISVNEIENFDVSQFDKDITRKLTFSWRLEGTTENVQILSIISSEQLQKINRQVRVPLIKLSKTLIEKHQRNIAAGQINDANSQRPEKDSQERSDQSIVFNDNVDSGTTSAATNMTTTTSISSTNDVNKHERLYKLKQDYHILKQQLTTLEEEVEAIKSRINGNNKTTSGYPSSFVLQNCIVNGNLRAGLGSFVPTAAKVKTATIDTTAAKTATITNDNTNVGITANANTTNIATIDANTATATNANVATAIDIANIHTVDSRECDETERRAQEDTIVPTTAAANTATIINIDPTIANADIIDTATANTDIVTIDTAEDERSVEESEEEESDDFMLVLSENNSVHSRQSALSNTTKSINEHSDNDFLKDKQKLLRAFRTAKKQDKGSKFVTTLCNVLWTREELAERCVKQSRICERRLLSPVKVKFIRSKFLNWIKQKDKNVHKEQRAFCVYLSRAIFTARLKYLRAQRRKR